MFNARKSIEGVVLRLGAERWRISQKEPLTASYKERR
jgi:hypothetical protein